MPQKKYQTATCAKLFGMAYIPCFFLMLGWKKKKTLSEIQLGLKHVRNVRCNTPKTRLSFKGATATRGNGNSKVTTDECDQGELAKSYWKKRKFGVGILKAAMKDISFYVYVARFGTSTDHFGVWLE